MIEHSASSDGTSDRLTRGGGGVARRLGAFSVPTRLVALICVVALALRLLLLNGYSTDYDEGVYWQSLRTLAQGHSLFGEIFSSQPPAFLLAVYPFYLLFGQSLGAARLTIAIFSIAGLIALYLAGRAIAGEWAGVVACALLAVDPLYLKESHTLQAEVPALVFQMVCIACAASTLRAIRRHRRILACMSGAALGIGMMTKLFDVVAIVPALLYIAAPLARRSTQLNGFDATTNRGMLPRSDVAKDIAIFGAGLLAAVVVVLLPFASQASVVYDQVVRFHVAAGDAAQRGLGYNLRLILRLGEFREPLLQTLSAYLPFLLALAATALAIRRGSLTVAAPLAWALLSLVVLIRQQPLFDHHLVLLTPPLALLAATLIPLASMLSPATAPPTTSVSPGSSSSTLPFPRLASAVVALTLLVNTAASIDHMRTSPLTIPDTQREMASALRAETLPRDTIISDDQYIAGLADRTVLPQLVDTSQVRIASGYLTAAQLESLVTRADVRTILFASGRFDAVPGFRQWVRDHYALTIDFGNGRALYTRQPSGIPIT